MLLDWKNLKKGVWFEVSSSKFFLLGHNGKFVLLDCLYDKNMIDIIVLDDAKIHLTNNFVTSDEEVLQFEARSDLRKASWAIRSDLGKKAVKGLITDVNKKFEEVIDKILEYK